MKKVVLGLKRVYSYFKRCPYCGFCGRFPDSGECPSCGEVS